MRDRSKWTPLFLFLLFVAAGTAALLTPGAGPDGECGASGLFDGRTVPDIAGLWEGTWEDTIYQASGAMSWDITVDGATVSGQGIIDFSYFSMGNQIGSGGGTIAAGERQTLSFTFEAPMIGDGSGAVVGNAVAGSGTVTPPLDFGEFTFVGTVTNEAAIGRFFFTSPSGGAGRVVMTNTTPVERTTWGSIKDAYRDDDDD